MRQLRPALGEEQARCQGFRAQWVFRERRWLGRALGRGLRRPPSPAAPEELPPGTPVEAAAMAIPLLRQAASIAIAAGLSHANPAAAAPSATPAPSATNATAVAPVAKGRLELHRTSRQLASSGDPIWELHLQLPRGERHVFEALVGRAHRQGGLASEAVAIAPLPPGRYHLEALTALDRQADHTLPAELGNLYWIGLEPQFRTDRRALGIHHDPSAGQKLESGTDGCIGLIRASDLLALGVLLQQHRPSELVVLH